MKRKFQLLLSLSVLSLLIISTISFTFIMRRIMLNILVDQVVEDNRVMGEQILDILTLIDYEDISEEKLVEYMQEICDQVMLPNEGFICVSDSKGNLVAFPGLGPDEEMSIAQAEFRSLREDMDEGNGRGVEELPPAETFEGYFINPEAGANDIIVSMPVKNTDFRILVHQSRAGVEERASRITKPILLLMLGFSLLISFFIFIVANIEVKRYENRLEKLNSKLMESNRLLEDSNKHRMQLLHMLSHDLANPIGAIKSICEMSQEEPDPETTAEYHSMVMDSAERSIGIINLVRKLEALETGKMKLELSPINLKNSIETSLHVLDNRCGKKNITFTVDVPEDMFVEAEYHSLGNSVFTNLFSNAVKFSPPGSEVKVAAFDEGSKVGITISDKGIGIPQDIQEQLFDVSAKTNRPGTEGEEGTGFGMPLVKSFVEHFGGEIRVYSVTREEDPKNHGTTFTLWLKKREN